MNGIQSLVYIPVLKPQAAFRLVCFPYAGGSSLSYLSWQDCLDENIELALIQLPGRGTRLLEAPFQTMEEIVESIYFALQKLNNKFLVFFGHSMGAKVAYEVILMIYRSNSFMPIHFIASASPAPCLLRTKKIYDLPDHLFIKELCELNISLIDIYNNQELLTFLMPALRADFKIIDRYFSENTDVIPCTVSVIAGTRDISISRADYELWFNFFTKNTGLSWVFGDHFFIESQSKDVLGVVQELLSLSEHGSG